MLLWKPQTPTGRNESRFNREPLSSAHSTRFQVHTQYQSHSTYTGQTSHTTPRNTSQTLFGGRVTKKSMTYVWRCLQNKKTYVISVKELKPSSDLGLMNMKRQFHARHAHTNQMARFYVRYYKASGTWCVDVENECGQRSRNSIPSFFPTKTKARAFAIELSQNLKIPTKQSSHDI